MNIKLQLVDHRSHSLPAGIACTLLAGGREVAKGASDADGVVSFDVGSETADGYSVRLDAWPGLEDAVRRVVDAQRS